MIVVRPSMGSGVLSSHVGALVVLWCLLATMPGAIVLPNRSLLHITVSGVPCLHPGGIPSYTMQRFLARLEGAAMVGRLRGAGPHGEQDYQNGLGLRRDSGYPDIGDDGGKGSEGDSLPEVRGGMRSGLLRSLRALCAGVKIDSFGACCRIAWTTTWQTCPLSGRQDAMLCLPVLSCLKWLLLSISCALPCGHAKMAIPPPISLCACML